MVACLFIEKLLNALAGLVRVPLLFWNKGQWTIGEVDKEVRERQALPREEVKGL